jgi:hypothetical protein
MAVLRPAAHALLAALALFACSKGPDAATGEPVVAAASACGAVGQSDCPLQGWMKANMTPAVTTGDFVRLERGFRRIAELAPEGYPSWRTAALAGADAASHGDAEGARRACKTCHDDSRARYRRELRTRALP